MLHDCGGESFNVIVVRTGATTYDHWVTMFKRTQVVEKYHCSVDLFSVHVFV